MKSFLILATLITLTACCGCMDKPSTTMKAPTDLACSTAKVSGMTCEACAMTVSQNLKKISGVKDVKVDVASGNVMIYSDKSSAVTSAKVKPVIEKSGYTFTSLNPTCN